jgi:hypothetical protein
MLFNKRILMKKSIIPFLLILFVIFSAIINSGCSQKSVKIKFDSSMEVSGAKFALKDISPGLPRNWDDYNFVVLEFRFYRLCLMPVRARSHREIPDLWNK